MQLKYEFSGYMHHTTFHNSYLENMIFFKQKFKVLLNRKKNGEEISSAMEEYLIDMADYVAHWWAEHIVKQDTIYANFIRKCQNKNGTFE
ncbi:hypothetical protein [Desulfovibrio sp. UCD-KL4C]|uniref:hypothetical protein n=1 Tax=Desulfovibrio sp. UCD-KL4C TaxID=2578120 RepID=UPI0025C64521|nr:hypothetical protein [Desulfovibrio sp. UCD-KL4C]